MLGGRQVPSGRWLVVVACAAILSCQPAPHDALQRARDLQPVLPETAQPAGTEPLYVNLPLSYTASLYLSPTDGGLVAEWPGGTRVLSLGSRFDDGRVGWRLVRDPMGNEGWASELYLHEQFSAMAPPIERDYEYLGAVRWDREIVFCINAAGGPAGLDGDAFVELVEGVAARWQETTDGVLPLESRGRCDNDPTALGDGMNAVGWVDDLGLAIAAQTWPNADQGIVTEMDIRLSRGYFSRLQARDPTRTLERCVFSTLVHEFGHLLGLDHPRSRAVASSMRDVGASRCDKGQPSEWDRANLLHLYGPYGSRP